MPWCLLIIQTAREKRLASTKTQERSYKDARVNEKHILFEGKGSPTTPSHIETKNIFTASQHRYKHVINT
uniref:Uncharacterized protein n=1 Tax=Physcomitrium patens TaxID=3218 RepID=A0A2K1KVB6_PHYPA|nr:hypothetical protein PHYPA_004729 [Physcomitrium patens]